MNDLAVAVRVIGEAVDQLTKLVEGMPKAIERKLAAHAASVDAKLEAYRKDFAALEVGLVNDISEQVVKLDALGVSVGEELTSFRQIIGDNQKAVEASVKVASDQLHEVIEVVSAAATKALDEAKVELSASIKEVRSACDTTDLHHAVKKLEDVVPMLATAEDVKKADEDLSNRLAHTRDRIKARDDEITKRIDAVESATVVLSKEAQEASASTQEGFVRVKAALDEQAQLGAVATKATEDALSALRERTQALEKATGEMGGVVETIGKQVTAVADDLCNLGKSAATFEARIVEVEKVSQGASEGLSALRAQVKAVAGDLRAELKESTEALATPGHIAAAVAAQDEARQAVSKALSEQIEELGSSFARMSAETMARMQAMAENIVEGDSNVLKSARAALSDAQKRGDEALAEVQGACTEADKAIKALSSTFLNLQNFASETREQVEDVSKAVELGATDLQSMRVEHKAFSASTGDALAKLEKGVAESKEAISAVAVSVKAYADETGEQVKELRNSVVLDLSAVNKRVDELPTPPEPFDAAAFEVRLLNKAAEMIPEHASMEVPAPVFDMAFEEGHLVVRAKWGDDEVIASTSVPVGFAYKGIYRPEEDYVTGNMVTHKGSMWYAKSKPTGEPGKDITGWQLAVKCGRDGRDATPARAYEGHEPGRLYKEADFLRTNNRLWQCVVKETTAIPEPSDITSTREWLLIGGVH